MDNSKSMRAQIDGATFMLEWSANVSVDTLEMIEQMLETQLRSVRAVIERMKAAEVTPAPEQGDAPDAGAAPSSLSGTEVAK